MQRQPDITKAKQLLSWEPKVSRSEGLKVTYEYFQSLSEEDLLYSRFIVGWQLSNILEKENQTMLLQQTIATFVKLEISNSEKGSQYTCAYLVKTLQELDIRISMDGKGRAIDNAIIERWFRTLKQ